MRFRIAAAVAAMAMLALTACEKSGNDGTVTPTPAPTAAPLAQEVNSALPNWSKDAYGKYAGKISEPTDATVLATFAGTNDGNTLDNPHVYKPNTVGDGMQVRYTCNPTLLIGGRDYILFKVGVLDAAGNPDVLKFSEVPASQTSGSWFFNFDWVTTVDLKTGNPKPFLSVAGDCKWEVNTLTFPKQPAPGK